MTETPTPIEQTKEGDAQASDWRAFVRRLGPAGPLAVLAAVLPALGGFLLLGTLSWIEPHLEAAGAVGVGLYIFGFAVLSGIAVLPTYAQAVLGGWVYKFPLGFPSAMLGVLGGALVGYVIGARATGDRLMKLVAERPRWLAVYRALLGSGFWRTLGIITLVRLNSPFALVNYVLAAARVNMVAYIVGTVVGLAPRTAAAVFIAAGLNTLTFEKTGPGQRWIWIASIVGTFITIMIIGHIANRAMSQFAAEHPEGAAAESDAAE